MSHLLPAPFPFSALVWGLAPWQHVLGKEPVGVCEGLCHALECPLQDPVPGALRDSPGCLLSLSIPLPERPRLFQLSLSHPEPNITLWVTSKMWSPVDRLCLLVSP